MENYGDNPAMARAENGLPFYYVYDSYQIDVSTWKRFFDKIRGTDLDGIFIGLYLDRGKAPHLELFDGFYTYFASNKVSQQSNQNNWKELKLRAERRNQLFVPSVGPGYDDTRVRPWNAQAVVKRR